MSKITKYLTVNQLLLLLILVIGTVLRFYRLADIPMTHDEFSALFRTDFSNFKDLIYFGVKTGDTHPAGVQILMYFLVNIFGDSSVMLKLPFLISGILTIFFSYKITSKWFTQSSALIVAAFIAILQYPINYSQIARPYGSGIFLSVLMVYFWSNLLFDNKNRKYLNIAGYILASSLCAYNHHFSLMFAGIVGLTGLFFLNKDTWKQYLISGVVIVLLYIPHLPIFLYQFSVGGVEEWLGKPQNDFLFVYLKYIFHYSYLMYAVVGLLILSSLIFRSEYTKRKKSLRVVAFLWFIIPYLIGFYYSRYVSAVLQYSVLIFTFPFLLILLFSYIKELNRYFNLAIVTIILTVGTVTLIFNREHYNLFYNDNYSEIILDAQEFTESLGEENVAVFLLSHKKISNYYMEKFELKDKLSYKYLNDLNFYDFKTLVKSLNTDYLYIGGVGYTNSEYLNIALNEFPYISYQRNLNNSEIYLLSKIDNGIKGFDYTYSNTLNFDDNNNQWTGVNADKLDNSMSFSGDNSFIIDSLTPYGPTFSCNLNDIIDVENSIIDISVKVNLKDTVKNSIMALSLESNGENIYWTSANFNNHVKTINSWETVYGAIKLADINLNYPDIILKVYVWNNNNTNFNIDDFKITTRKENRYIYAILEDF